MPWCIIIQMFLLFVCVLIGTISDKLVTLFMYECYLCDFFPCGVTSHRKKGLLQRVEGGVEGSIMALN